MQRIRALLVGLFVVAFGGALAQSALYTVHGPGDSALGSRVALAGDVLAAGGVPGSDGVPDFVVTSTGPGPAGERAIVVSGADGVAATTHLGPPGFEQGLAFGAAVDAGADVTGDAVPDILVGAPNGAPGSAFSATGSAFLYSGATLTLVRFHASGDTGAYLGTAVALLPDLDGDGIGDYALGATYDGLPSGLFVGTGQVFLHSGATGALFRTLVAPAKKIAFASSLLAVGDVTGDAVPDIAVGSPGFSSIGLSFDGAVHLYDGASAGLVYTAAGAADVALIGRSLAVVGTYDHDAWPDFATNRFEIGVPVDGAMVLSGVSGSVLKTVQGSVVNSGPSGYQPIDATADLDGDGLPELVLASRGIGYSQLEVRGSQGGQLLYAFGQSGPVSDLFAFGVATLGDVTGDGRDDWVVTDPAESDAPGSNTGAAWVVSDRTLAATPGALPASQGARIDLDLHASAAHAGSPYALLMSATLFEEPACSAGPLHAGQVDLALCQDIVFDLSLPLLLANVPPFHSTVGLLDGTGHASAALDLTGVVLPPAAVGLHLHFQAIAKGGASQPAGVGPWSFVSSVASVEIVP